MRVCKRSYSKIFSLIILVLSVLTNLTSVYSIDNMPNEAQRNDLQQQNTEQKAVNYSYSSLLANNQKTAQLELKNYANTDNATMYAALWSQTNGQDDLVWYKLDAVGDSYAKTINIKEHKNNGTYSVDYYANSKFLGHDELVVEAPKVNEIKITNINNSAGKFTVLLDDLSCLSGIEKVQIPVWCDSNQSDLVWYTAKLGVDGNYYVDVDSSKHKDNIGLYKADVYVTDGNGFFSKVGGTTHDMKTAYDFTVTKNSQETKINATLSKYKTSKVCSIKVAVWSDDNGQDDLEWVNATRKANGEYAYSFDVSKHKSYGLYNIHVYENLNGKMNFLKEATVDITKPTVELSAANINSSKFRIEAIITNVPSGIKKVQIPVWSQDNQSDLIWYTAIKKDDSHYYIDVDISKHNNSLGKYMYSCYTTTNNCGFSGVPDQSIMVQVKIGTLLATVNQQETNVKVTLNDCDLGSAKTNSIKFAIWSEAGDQDDLAWYTANTSDYRQYYYNVDVSKHHTSGNYVVDAYICSKTGQMTFLSRTNFEIKDLVSVSMKATNQSYNQGKYKIVIDINAPAGVKKVQIPVWCDNDQNDILWYNATKVSNSRYEVEVNINNHKYHYGNFKYDAYVTTNNNIRTNAGHGSTDFNVIDYLVINKVGQSIYKATLYNPNGGDVSEVLIPTWSETNGQDDLVWYAARNIGNNVWTVEIKTTNHKNSGQFHSDAYARINGELQCVARKEYSIPQSDFLTGMDLMAQGYGSNTNYLILTNTVQHQVGIYYGSSNNWTKVNEYVCTVGAPSTPTVRGDFSIYKKGRYFDSGASRCFYYSAFYGGYYFHSVLYYKDNVPLRVMDGRLGMDLSHGCVRLQVDNAKWIYDNCPIGTRVIVY